MSTKELYKDCERCQCLSYLTEGGFYLCTLCGQKEYLVVKETQQAYQEIL